MKGKGFGNGFGRELDAWQWNDWQAGEHGHIEWSRGGMEPGQYLDGKEELREGSY